MNGTSVFTILFFHPGRLRQVHTPYCGIRERDYPVEHRSWINKQPAHSSYQMLDSRVKYFFHFNSAIILRHERGTRDGFCIQQDNRIILVRVMFTLVARWQGKFLACVSMAVPSATWRREELKLHALCRRSANTARPKQSVDSP